MKNEDMIRATPSSRWSEVVMEEGGVVSKLASLGARMARGGVLFVERPNLYRVTEWLRERGMTWQQVPGYAIDEAVKLGEMDPVSLVNSILFNPEQPYSWTRREEQEWYPDAPDIEFAKEREKVRVPDQLAKVDVDTLAFRKANESVDLDVNGIFEDVLKEVDNTTVGGDLEYGWQDDDMTDHPVGESDPEGDFYEDLRRKLLARAMQEAPSSSSDSSSSSESSSSSDSSETPDSESSEGDGLTGMTEKSQAGTYSSDPSYNPCALFLRSFCRVDGRPCLYRKDTYKDCPKRGTGLKCAKEALAIPPGQEDNKTLNKPAFGA